ncbi:MAG: respiratory nitrate reductase subunit gamma [Spirochaetes bacterium]|nr:respiratory nitrate reductase subunit gamma [Spirochaetota bacterium]
MFDLFFFGVLPYLALALCLVVGILRFTVKRFSYSSLSSQFLEHRTLFWASLPWHLGIFAVLLGHFAVFLFPGFFRALLADHRILLAFEATGLIAAFISLIGLALFTVRRVFSGRIQSVTTTMDLAVLVLLLLQVGLGILTATLQRWGSLWATGVLAPYFDSLFRLQPDLALVKDLPFIIKAHAVLAFVIVGLIPFSRLIHMVSLPFTYIPRRLQIVIWNFRRRKDLVERAALEDESRRQFLRGATGVGIGAVLIGVGTLDKVVPFFKGPDLTKEEREELLSLKVKKLKATAEQKALELERMQSETLFVANLKDLKRDSGTYFIDYQMSPGLAFLDAAGLPLLYSAKCPHLGCTVNNKAEGGLVVCPCHVSHFRVADGGRVDGPTPTGLRTIPHLLKDAKGALVTAPEAARLGEYQVFIAKGERS